MTTRDLLTQVLVNSNQLIQTTKKMHAREQSLVASLAVEQCLETIYSILGIKFQILKFNPSEKPLWAELQKYAHSRISVQCRMQRFFCHFSDNICTYQSEIWAK